jgi:hypothetical protein
MIKRGSKVKLQFILKVEGEVLHNSVGQEPLAYEHGAGQIFSGLEEQLEGLEAGITKEDSRSSGKGRWALETGVRAKGCQSCLHRSRKIESS